MGAGRIEATGVDLQGLAATLSTRLGRQVLVDRPRTGRFDLALNWDATSGDPVLALMHAMEAQLGISVLDQQRPVPVIRIRSVRRPV